jgi:hypothetical protein
LSFLLSGKVIFMVAFLLFQLVFWAVGLVENFSEKGDNLLELEKRRVSKNCSTRALQNDVAEFNPYSNRLVTGILNLSRKIVCDFCGRNDEVKCQAKTFWRATVGALEGICMMK